MHFVVYSEPRVEDQHSLWGHIYEASSRYVLGPLVTSWNFNEMMWGYKHFSVFSIWQGPERHMAAFQHRMEGYVWRSNLIYHL